MRSTFEPSERAARIPAGDPALHPIAVVEVGASGARARRDVLAVEEPLEIRLGSERSLALVDKTISVTMRTPGHDLELAAGLLLSEGVIRSREPIASIAHCGPKVRADGTSNVVKVRLGAHARLDFARLERHVATTSACGLCGKTSLDAIRATHPPPLAPGAPRIDAALVPELPRRLREHQAAFDRTGGLHAAGLFDAATGEAVVVREDVGRHNAVDKLFGERLLAGALPCADAVLVVSGRASFELAQKALMAGAPILAAVGAPSSLAVELAREHGMTLLGFVRDGRFVVYAGRERVLA